MVVLNSTLPLNVIRLPLGIPLTLIAFLRKKKRKKGDTFNAQLNVNNYICRRFKSHVIYLMAVNRILILWQILFGLGINGAECGTMHQLILF